MAVEPLIPAVQLASVRDVWLTLIPAISAGMRFIGMYDSHTGQNFGFYEIPKILISAKITVMRDGRKDKLENYLSLYWPPNSPRARNNYK